MNNWALINQVPFITDAWLATIDLRKHQSMKQLTGEEVDLENVNNPYDVLDAVLRGLKETSEDKPIPRNDALNQSDQFQKLSDRDKRIVFEKLERDGYAQRKNQVIQNQNTDIWYITFEGILLLREKGYVQREINTRLARRNAHRNERKLRGYTLWLAIGTWLAGIYFVVELVRFFYSLFHAPPTL